MRKRSQKTLYLDTEVYDEFKKFCEEGNLSMSGILERMMGELVKDSSLKRETKRYKTKVARTISAAVEAAEKK